MSKAGLSHAALSPLTEPFLSEPDLQPTARALESYTGAANPNILQRLERIQPIYQDTAMLQVLDVFREHQEEHFFPVIQTDGRPLGLIRERELKGLVYSRYGQSLLQNKNTPKDLEMFLTSCPSAELDAPSAALLALVQDEQHSDGIIITGHGRYVGVLRMRALVELAHQEQLALVEQHNEALEQRNADIQSVLDNMRQGICSILPDLTVHSDHSAHLRRILETQQIAEQPIMALLFDRCRLGADARHQLRAALMAILGEDELAFELNAHLLPNELVFAADSSVKTLELHWSPVSDAAGTIVKLMLVVRDITAVRGLQHQAERQQRELERLGQILRAGETAFTGFLASGKRLLDTAGAALETAAVVDSTLLDALYRPMHTLKGNARTLGLAALADTVHAFEQQLEALRGEASAESGPLRTALAEVSATLEAYRALYRERLQGFGGSDAQLDKLRQWAHAERADFDYNRFLALLERLDGISLRDCVDRLGSGLARIATELNKPAPILDVQGGEIGLTPRHAELLENALGHLLRNALDHGIEPPAERERAGKAGRGRIRIAARQDDDGLRLEISDDGAGLNLTALREKAAANGLSTPEPSDDSLAEWVFRSGVSTAATISQISGRGVGLDAVRHNLRTNGGDVRVEFTAPRHGVRRSFKLCLSLPIR